MRHNNMFLAGCSSCLAGFLQGFLVFSLVLVPCLFAKEPRVVNVKYSDVWVGINPIDIHQFDAHGRGDESF